MVRAFNSSTLGTTGGRTRVFEASLAYRAREVQDSQGYTVEFCLLKKKSGLPGGGGACF